MVKPFTIIRDWDCDGPDADADAVVLQVWAATAADACDEAEREGIQRLGDAWDATHPVAVLHGHAYLANC